MKKLFIITTTIGLLGSSIFANWGVGYNGRLDQVILRIPISSLYLEPGIGFLYDDSESQPGNEREFGMGVSASILFPLWDYTNFTTFFKGGGNIRELRHVAPPDNDDIGISIFAGLQPEVTFWDHFAVSTFFGLDIPLVPDLEFGTYGQGLFDFTDGAFIGFSFLIKFSGAGSSSGYTPSSSSSTTSESSGSESSGSDSSTGSESSDSDYSTDSEW
jgi:hypothetical protein